MNNVTEMANQLNVVGVKSCKAWAGGHIVRLEMNNGRVQWTANITILGRAFSFGTAKGGR